MAKGDSKKSGSSALVGILPIITVLIAIVYAAAAYFLLFFPKLGELMSGGGLDTAGIVVQLNEQKTYLTQLENATGNFRRINPEHKSKVERIIPVGPDVPGLFVQLDEIATTNNMVLVSVDTVLDGLDKTELGVKKVRVAMNVFGADYKKFKIFLADLERSQRLMDVQSIVFSPETGSYGISLVAYYLEEEDLS